MIFVFDLFVQVKNHEKEIVMTDEKITLICDDGSKVNFRAAKTEKGTTKPGKDSKQEGEGEIKGMRFCDLNGKGAKCANCMAVAGIGSIKTLKKCGRCKKVYYCDVECQKYHWQTVHKLHCQPE